MTAVEPELLFNDLEFQNNRALEKVQIVVGNQGYKGRSVIALSD